MATHDQWVWTETARIFMPNVQFENLPEGHSRVPLKGYAFVQAVFLQNECVGWILKS